MNARTLLTTTLALCLLAFLPASHGASLSRTEAYLGYGGPYQSDDFYTCGHSSNVGGVCFPLTGDGTMDVSAIDDRGVPVPVYVRFVNAADLVVGDAFFACGSAEGIVAPEGATGIAVAVQDPAFGVTCSPSPLLWTPHGPTGIITLTEHDP